MKRFILLINLLLFPSFCFCNTYYVSADGNDTNDGLSTATPIKTIAKLNLIALAAGDTVLFRRNDVFEGEIEVPYYEFGNNNNPLTFDAYGIGNQPMISGSINVNSTFIEISPNIWKTSLAVSNVKDIFVNNQQYSNSRFPNVGYLTIDAANSNTQFSDAALNQANNYWNNAVVKIRTNYFSWKKRKISNFTASTVTLNSPTEWTIEPNWGYYLENKLDALDAPNEWFFNATTQELYLYSSNNPSSENIKGSIYDYGIKADYNATNITLKNLTFSQQAISGAWFQGSASAIVINGCNFNQIEQFGIELGGNDDAIAENHLVENCNFNAINGVGISLFHVNNSIIRNNIFNEIGTKNGYGVSGTGNAIGCRIWDSSEIYIGFNEFQYMGQNAIALQANSCTIEKNKINTTHLVYNDSGAIGSYGTRSHHNIIRNNFISNIHYNLEASNPNEFGKNVAGIYLDNYTSFATVEKNTIYNSDNYGIINNANATNNSYLANVCYNYSDDGIIFSDYVAGASVTNCSVNGSIFYALSATQRCVNLLSEDNNYNVGTFNNNYYCNPYSDYVVKKTSFSASPQEFTLADWKLTSSTDLNTLSSYYSWNLNENHSELIKNETNTPVTITLNGSYVNLDNNAITSVNLEPYTSTIVINTTFLSNSVFPINKNRIALTPNPAENEIKINGNINGVEEVTIYNFLGQFVSNKNINQSNYINISDLQNGIYFVKIGSESLKFIKNSH